MSDQAFNIQLIKGGFITLWLPQFSSILGIGGKQSLQPGLKTNVGLGGIGAGRVTSEGKMTGLMQMIILIRRTERKYNREAEASVWVWRR